MSVELIEQESRLWLSLAQGALLSYATTGYATSYLLPRQDGKDRVLPIVDWQGRVVQTNDLILYAASGYGHDYELRLARVLEITETPLKEPRRAWNGTENVEIVSQRNLKVQHLVGTGYAIRKHGDQHTIREQYDHKQWATITRYDGVTDYPSSEHGWRTGR